MLVGRGKGTSPNSYSGSSTIYSPNCISANISIKDIEMYPTSVAIILLEWFN